MSWIPFTLTAPIESLDRSRCQYTRREKALADYDSQPVGYYRLMHLTSGILLLKDQENVNAHVMTSNQMTACVEVLVGS
jgi:hypothetical protein